MEMACVLIRIVAKCSYHWFKCCCSFMIKHAFFGHNRITDIFLISFQTSQQAKDYQASAISGANNSALELRKKYVEIF